ncbi:hypothetical protein EOL72_01080 [Candidatus Falkowbacteria bacterium]|jgi:hypothetical protein|nr:hypothetical protein [Patescibacteria group bacterium]MDD3435180.1 hypothetical protein [Patescibacteria group bacterium]MDD4466638.1 hypothetical protein [Patescibacteria group bacterium]NCU42933.1 hypothetical protein [Candidatus Falkowbacteria bacterium]
MFETSGDILNLVLMVCIAVLTFFICWALYYVIATVSKAKRLVDKADRIINNAEGLLSTVKSTLSDSGLYLKFFNLMAGQILNILKNRPFRWAATEKNTSTTQATRKKATVKKKVSKKKSAKK